MAISVTCSGCDRTMKVKDDFAGQRALCPFCKAEVRVPTQERAGEKSGYAFADADEPPRRDDRDDEPRRPRRREEDDEPRRRPRLRDEDEDIPVRKRKSSGGGTSGGVLSGVLMMVGALIWFFGGAALGVYFIIYPPILFIVGLVTFIKGLAGNSD